jgi:hypothetical protein
MAAERKRPWYLVLALLGALALGTTGACNGWGKVMLYREPVDVSLIGEGIADPADRAAVESRMEAYLRAVDAAKPRGWPLAVAMLLLGGAMVVFSMRAMGGSGGARAALVQLVVAQAGVNAASHWLLRDVLDAEVRFGVAAQVAKIHESETDRARADEKLRATGWAAGIVNPLSLALSTLGSAFVVVALTRRRSRDFFDAASAALEER